MSIILTEAQKTIARDNTRFRVVNCGRRFGKTTLAIEEMIGKAISKAGRKVCYIAPTFQQARDIVWQELIKRIDPIKERVNETRLEVDLLAQGGGLSSIVLRGWEARETLRGQKFNMIILDEVSSMKEFWPTWHDILEPTLLDVVGDAMFISTPKGFNHFYDLYMKEKEDEEYKSFHFTTYDNPHLPLAYLDKKRESLPEDSFAQEYLADFRRAEGLVYKEFDRVNHVYADYDMGQIVETLVGVDFGYTNPAAVLTIKKNFDNHYFVTQEWYKTGKTDLEVAEHVKTLRATHVYPDPENPAGIKELKNQRISVREVNKGKGSVLGGIQKVRELLKQNRLHIHSSCKNLIHEIETYHYGEKKENKNEEELPIKENDHALDALRYVLMMNDYRTPHTADEDFNIYGTVYT